jgi:16S rRNA (cytidine1402-2'-O)-methyltransferase
LAESILAPFPVVALNPFDALLARRAAADAAGGQNYPAGALYVVATPIGNLADLTFRAVHVLGLVDAIACEDTRHSGPLLRLIGIDAKPLLAVHEHNEREAAAVVLERLARGERVAYVSDAGTPAVSDPGAALVAAAQAAGYRTVPIPGASSALAALSVAGDATEGPFVFVGFLAAKAGERAAAVQALAADARTQLLFEAPHRVEALAASLAAVCDDRMLTVCRELTKQFETVQRLAAREFPAWLAADGNRSRGEFVIVVHARAAAVDGDAATAHDAALRTLLAALPLKQAVALAAELTGAPRNALYERALAWKRASADADVRDDNEDDAGAERR